MLARSLLSGEGGGAVGASARQHPETIMTCGAWPILVIVVDRNADCAVLRVAADYADLRAILCESTSSAKQPPILDLEAAVLDEADAVPFQR
jgi:hypothetical protein